MSLEHHDTPAPIHNSGRSRGLGLLLMALVALAALAVDQAAKAWITANMLIHEARPIVEGFLRLRYTQNTGAAFGLFKDATGLLTVAAIIIIGAIVVSATRIGSGSRVLLAGLGLVLGGALGNLSDRLRLGYVVDLLEAYGLRVEWNGMVYTFPVFNLADSAITIGVLLIMATLFFSNQDAPAPPQSRVDEPATTLPVRRRQSPWFGKD